MEEVRFFMHWSVPKLDFPRGNEPKGCCDQLGDYEILEPGAPGLKELV